MNHLRSISRRTFTRQVLIAAPAVLLSPWQAVAALAAPKGPGCTPTEPLELGPFHREGAPWRTALSKPGEPGRPLAVSGLVRGEDTCGPLSEVLLDVWQADAAGRYDFQDNPPPKSPSEYRLRGLLRSDRTGRYAFTSVLPGNYGSRARHVHYLIRRPGYEPLITQLYFQGDPRNEQDPLVRRSLIMPVRAVPGGGAAVTFDVVLRRERPVGAGTLRTFGDYVGEYADARTGDTMRVERRGSRLVAVFGRDDAAELRPRGGTRFLAAEWAAQLTFVRDEHGRVAELLGDLDDGRHARLKKMR
jgi:protocatechuate 3,4-dioxygenase beta subunit